MKNSLKFITVLASAVMLTGCVIEESNTDNYSGSGYTGGYYSSGSGGYMGYSGSVYERPHHRHHYVPPTPRQGYYSSGSSGYSSGYRSSVTGTPANTGYQPSSGYHSTVTGRPAAPAPSSGYQSTVTGTPATPAPSSGYESTVTGTPAAPAPSSGYQSTETGTPAMSGYSSSTRSHRPPAMVSGMPASVSSGSSNSGGGYSSSVTP